ncbi:heavy metal-responsive transcriptional regulator [Pseudonocardia spinosispora]|uniref:heavy metal-responsive transcriptional regulator n=1 Tax=Pseudonocardia spinosispora TaxID=103441 RepID=UPI000419C2F8|nr:heavy metal-responsive transcriptional regulator [Pseudonocardia spinosispora]
MRIGDLSTRAGLTVKTIRFYERIRLLPEPPRTSGGYRDYPPEALARLTFIRRAKATGLTLAEIRDILAIRDGGQPPCRHVSDLIDRRLADIEERISELRSTRDALHLLRRRASTISPAECGTEDICRILVTDHSVVEHCDRRRVERVDEQYP